MTPAAPASRELPFHVDIAGVVELLGRSLYSRRDTPVRELLQNAHDAIVRRQEVDLDFRGEIRIAQDEAAGTLTFSDNGIGLDAAEAETYLTTLGIGLSGVLRREDDERGPGERIIGRFGIGLFSAFLLADRVVVDSLRSEACTPVRWEAGMSTTVHIGPGTREAVGTTVTLHLRKEERAWSRDADRVEAAVRHYADALPVPIHLGDSARRLNVMTPSWLEPTPDAETISLELEQRFEASPLDVLVVRHAEPRIQGAIYVSQQRVPGFSERPLVSATVRRMVISHRLDGLFPAWASFYRGALELPDLRPTASREDVIRDAEFEATREAVHALLLARLRELKEHDPVKLQSIITWHRYSLAGAALDEPELREILRDAYRFQTTAGPLTFTEIVARAKPAAFGAPEVVIWFHSDRSRGAWAETVFRGRDLPCVQATRTFESTLLTAFADDAEQPVTIEMAGPENERFVERVLGLAELHDVDEAWTAFFAPLGIRVRSGDINVDAPVVAFPSRAAELRRDVKSLERDGSIPPAFARLMDRHFKDLVIEEDQAVLNEKHKLVQRALAGSVHAPLASVLRLLVHLAMTTAGLASRREQHATIEHDLGWIAETVAAGEG